MAGRCTCGVEPTYDLGCLECGASCCPACAVSLESAGYCRRCARSLLEVATIRPGGVYQVH